MGLAASILWIVVGVIYIAYKYFKENQIGFEDLFEAIKGTLPIMLPLLVGVLLVNIAEGSTSVVVSAICAILVVLLSVCFFAFIIWAEWSDRQDTKKRQADLENCNQCISMIDSAIKIEIDSLPISKDMSVKARERLCLALRENRFPEFFDLKEVVAKIVCNDSKVKQAYDKVIELRGFAHPVVCNYTIEQMQTWFSGTPSPSGKYRAGGFCSGEDAYVIKAELTHLGIDYSRYDVAEIERRKRAEEQRINATFPHRATIDSALYQEIDALPLSDSMSESCRSKIRMALRDNRFPELFDLEAVFASLVEQNPKVQSANINLKLQKFEYPEIPSYTHEEMQEWFERVGDDEFISELMRLGANLSPYIHRKV